MAQQTYEEYLNELKRKGWTTLTKEDAEEILKRFPRGYYAGRDIPMKISYDPMQECSYADLIQNEISISYNQLCLVMFKPGTSFEEKEETVRANLAHELLHVLLTPKELLKDVANYWREGTPEWFFFKDGTNICCDERIERDGDGVFLKTHFEEWTKKMNGYDWFLKSGQINNIQTPDQLLYNVVRFHHNIGNLYDEWKKLFMKHKAITCATCEFSWGEPYYNYVQDLRNYLDLVLNYFKINYPEAYNRWKNNNRTSGIIEIHVKRKDLGKTEGDPAPIKLPPNVKIIIDDDEDEDKKEDEKEEEGNGPGTPEPSENKESEESKENGKSSAKEDKEDEKKNEEETDGPSSAHGANSGERGSSEKESSENPKPGESKDPESEKLITEEEKAEICKKAFEGLNSHNPYENQVLVHDINEIIFRRNKRLGQQSGGSYGISGGRIQPRRLVKPVETNDYRWFKRVSGNTLDNNEKLHLILWLDQSGSYSCNDAATNKIINALIQVEQKCKDFKFDLVRMAWDVELCEKAKHNMRSHSNGGTGYLADAAKKLLNQLVNPKDRTVNLLLFDGTIGKQDDFWKLFNNKDTIIISERGNFGAINRCCKKVFNKVSVDYDYPEHLAKKLTELLKKQLA